MAGLLRGCSPEDFVSHLDFLNHHFLPPNRLVSERGKSKTRELLSLDKIRVSHRRIGLLCDASVFNLAESKECSFLQMGNL